MVCLIMCGVNKQYAEKGMEYKELMKKRKWLLLAMIVFTLSLAACGNETESDYEPRPLANMKEDIFIGDSSIGEYTVYYSGSSAKSAALTFQSYIKRTCGKELKVSGGNVIGKAVSFNVDKDAETVSTEITDGNIVVTAPTQAGLDNEMHCLLNTYFGWMFAGYDNEAISDEKTVLHIPSDVTAEASWIEEREPIVTLWKTNYVRGNYYNENSSTLTDIMNYSDAQLYEYVKMMKWCGYTGIQVTDMCATWTGMSGYRFAQERLRLMADAAHSMGMNFTLWVWAANFDNFGWIDEEVTYDKGDYEFQYQNPDVIATFDKYYDIYAELADVCDRVICHFYDPGNLETADDVGYFAKMFKDKLQAINPEIDFGISCWVDAFDLGVILSYTGADVTVYEGNNQADGGNDGSLRNKVYTFAARLGTWSWNTCGMEIDQLSSMQYNSNLLKNTYNRMSRNDEIMKPGYWSEMDSYHILNAFSLYCGGHLLQNPDRDLEELTNEIALSSVGPEYAEVLADTLKLLEMARTGDDWDTYWWKSENYILAGDSYPAGTILEMCDKLIPELNEMKEAKIEGYYMPTPISMSDIIGLVIPHIEQIRDYAKFRIAFEELKSDYNADGDKDKAAEKLLEIATPISEYNAIIGVWGQIEARQQRIMVLDFCEETGVEVPLYPYYDYARKNHIVDAMAMQQRGYTEPVSTWTFSAGSAYHTEERRLIDELIEEGVFTADEGIWYHLTNWEDYKYTTN